ncbi:MAG: glycosyltransferase family 2 protein [Betaproteobacteria bacterium]|jgi:glycosyltransferase involved in cell wall biosynthesis|nr:glycosyltransferase family 2 protein [Pseudomonadota bacterium]NBP39105.1 glycosyltransferase family 2 protein [Betaproteobacteria bacterium]NBQ77553.1 glycosyltransferase family 2 protein [Betaproteobacteria bacterium]NBY54572.1 glycosyltransferase family 2 protein [Betaproteobacteria bacterium]NCV14635.1 glycosyltransferase family 2 protein [Betaproteobacteria bacterium]
MASPPVDTDKPLRLTVAILTLNEEKRIAACIRSASFADQIIVADSGSKDRTVDIAQALGAEVYLYPDWQGFAVQRNRILAHAKADYIFFLDADEVFTPELVIEVEAAVASGRDQIWEVMWHQVAFGKPLTRMRTTSGVQRLFRRESIRAFSGVVHEAAELKTPGLPVSRFKGRLLHYSRESIHGSLLKLAQYAQLGAAKRAQAGKRGGVILGLLSSLATFVRMYFFRGGVLCGPEGFLFCLLVALEGFFRYAALEYDRDQLDKLASRG